MNDTFARQAVQMTGRIAMAGRYKSRFSAVMPRGVLPEESGFNFQSVQVERTKPTGANGWQRLLNVDGVTVNCVAAPDNVASATTIRDYSPVVTALESEDICLAEARTGYMFRDQTAKKMKNFENNVSDTWNDKDRYEYILACKYKICLADVGGAPPMNINSLVFPAAAPTSPITQGTLRTIRTRLIQDGAGENNSYATKDGAPTFLLFMSSEDQAQLLLQDSNTRQDFNYAYQGLAEASPLLKAFGIDRSYGGLFHMIDDKMPRYSLSNGVWTEIAYYEDVATSIGNSAEVAVAYNNADYSDIIVWCPEVTTRLVPKTLSTAGGSTKFDPVDYAGAVQWLNIKNRTTNPNGTVGFWRADLEAAYKPEETRYGYTVRVKRCRNRLWSFALCS